ncbi:MAG: hypothetical protein ABL962_18285, partial [Fimbriimonadaceae bacterium]
QQNAIRAYRPYVAETDHLEHNGHTPGQVRAASAHWLQGYLSGELQPLTPVEVGDSVNEGIKRQIRCSRDWLMFTLRLVAKKEEAAGKHDQAFTDYIQALRLGQILKGSDATAERVSSSYQSEILRELMRIAPSVSKSSLTNFVVTANTLKKEPDSLDRIIRQFGAMVMQDKKAGLKTYGGWGPLLAKAKSGVILPSGLIKTISEQPRRLADVPQPLAELYLATSARKAYESALERTYQEVLVLLNPENVPTVRLSQLNL